MRQPIVMISWVLWGALLVFVGFYAGMTRFLQPSASDPGPLLTYIMLAASAFNVVVVLIVRFFLRRFIRQENKKPSPAWAGRYLPMAILIWALSEAVSIYGLVLFLIGVPAMTSYIFTGLSIILLVINMPALLIPKDEASKATGPLDRR